MMDSEIHYSVITTADGSKTLLDPETGECFKSQHASATESWEVFYQPAVIQHPLWNKESPLRILELGFGTGTNLRLGLERDLPIEYVSIDKTYSPGEFFQKIDPYPNLSNALQIRKGKLGRVAFHLIEGEFEAILAQLILEKRLFEVIFFDPFSPLKNPSVWTPQIFSLAFELLSRQGRLVTYSVSRVAKDSAAAAGFTVHKLALPKILKKRSSLLAIKP